MIISEIRNPITLSILKRNSSKRYRIWTTLTKMNLEPFRELEVQSIIQLYQMISKDLILITINLVNL
jgi:hypothetical protein